MIKVSAAIFKYNDKVLLMRRAFDQPYAGFWEFPGGKAEQGERTSAALKRELQEELSIDANVGKLITSAAVGNHEVFAYSIKSYDGDIKLSVHDDMQWVPLDGSALKYNLLPADRKILMHITKTNHKSAKKISNFESVLGEHISRPVFNSESNRWDVAVHYLNKTQQFTSERNAIDFYIQEARKVINKLQGTIQIEHTK